MAHVSYSDAGAAVGDGFNREEVLPPFQSQQEHPVLDFAAGKEEHATAMENDKEELERKEEDQPPSDDALELKKKRVLEEVESSILVPKEDLSSLGLGLGIGIIKVIDETALLETVPSSSSSSCFGNGKPKKQSRRRGGAGGGKKSVVTVNVSGPKKYSTKELEALRFVNVGQQRKFWKSIYARLQSPVAKEYDSLAATHHHHGLPNHKPPPPILSK